MKSINRVALVVAFAIFCCQSVLGQAPTTDQLFNLRNVIPPSPNVAALGKYVEWPVNLNTGVPDINIPLYELKGRTMSVPISLSYHASGIKVGELASWVGLGWSLQSGGVITRSVRGLPDECTGAGYTAYRKMFPNYDSTFSLLPSNDSAVWKSYVIDQASGQADGVHDLFFLNAMGRSYRLLFHYAGTVLQIQTVPFSNLQVTADAGLTSWTVVLEDGTSLAFGGTGYIESTTNSRTQSPCGASFNSSWYLKSITSPVGEKINFTYTATPSVQMATYLSQYDALAWGTNGTVVLDDASVTSRQEVQTISILQPDSIISETGFVKFIAGSNRSDLPGAKALSGIALYSRVNGQTKAVDYFTLSTHQAGVTTGYEYSADTTTYRYHHRLMLDSIAHNGAGSGIASIPKWKFTYNSTLLPSTQSYAQDHYGYYNGATSNTSLLPLAVVVGPYGNCPITSGFFPPNHTSNNRDPNATYMQASILTDIRYPTGGTSHFTYEANNYSPVQEHFQNTVVHLDDVMTLTDTAHVKSYTFQITQPQYISLSFTSSLPSDLNIAGAQCSAQITSTLLSANQSIKMVNSGDLQYFVLPAAGTYKFSMSSNFYSTSLGTNDSVPMHATLTYVKSLGTSAQAVMTGGLRVKSIIDSDAINPSKNMARYFTYSTPQPLNVINPQTDYLTTMSGSNSSGYYYRYTRNSNTRYNLGSGGTALTYGNVTTSYGSSGQNGKIQTTFANTVDVNYSGLSENLAPYPDLDTREFERGLLMSEVKMDNLGNKIEATYNQYKLLARTKLIFFKASMKAFVQAPDPCVIDPTTGFCHYLIVPETLSTDQVQKTSSLHSIYRKITGGYDSLSVLTTYAYETPANMQATKITTTDSKGATVTQYKRTAFEKSAIVSALSPVTLTTAESSAVDAMLSRNMVGTVIQQEEQLGGALTNRVTTQYLVSALNSTVIAPESIVVQTGGASAGEVRVQFTQYDNKGNLLEQRKSKAEKHNYIYDYNLAYPVAEVVNADVNSVAYTSFEADGTGNWTIGSSSRDGTQGYTGSRSFALSAGSVSKTGLTSSSSYKVSFWAKGGNVLINGVAAPTANMVRQGWSYYEKVLTGVTSVTLSGTGNIDEVRLYPATAQMTTYTYIPQVGIQSMMDARSAATFYEYDGLQRLVIVRDDKGKILKTFQYHYKSH